METFTIDWKVWSLIMMIILWSMKNEKIKVIFGETGKLLRNTFISKIAQAFIMYYKSKEKTNPEP